MKQKYIVSVLISIILISILLPIGISIFYEYEVSRTTTTSLNNSRTNILLNESISGAYNYSVLEPSFTNTTDIALNTTCLLSADNFTLKFRISLNDSSLVTVVVANVTINSALTLPFNDSTQFNTSFVFNTLYTKSDIPIAVIELELNLILVISSNVTMSTSTYIYETYTDDTTESIQAIYVIVPLLLVVGIVMMFIKKTDD